MASLNLVVVGVGGQGLITLSTIIAEAAMRRGYGALVAETHGLSQRGGTVVVHVRLGEVDAPLIPEASADAMLAMELIEAARYRRYLRPGAVVVANDYVVPPPLPGVEAPSRDRLVEMLRERAGRVELVDATARALRLGDSRTANIVLLGKALASGVLAPYVDFEAAAEVIGERFPKARDVNLQALRMGARG